VGGIVSALILNTSFSSLHENLAREVQGRRLLEHLSIILAFHKNTLTIKPLSWIHLQDKIKNCDLSNNVFNIYFFLNYVLGMVLKKREGR